MRDTFVYFSRRGALIMAQSHLGQLLMIEEGVGLHQIRGRAIEEFQPGEPFWTPAGVEHWHGAHPDVDALQLTIYEGTVNWLEPTTDEQYGGVRYRPMSRSSN